MENNKDPTTLIIYQTSSTSPRRIFIPMNRYGRPKNGPKFLKTSPILFFTLISLITVHFSYLINL